MNYANMYFMMKIPDNHRQKLTYETCTKYKPTLACITGSIHVLLLRARLLLNMHVTLGSASS
jgi:hypothetical protein